MEVYYIRRPQSDIGAEKNDGWERKGRTCAISRQNVITNRHKDGVYALSTGLYWVVFSYGDLTYNENKSVIGSRHGFNISERHLKRKHREGDFLSRNDKQAVCFALSKEKKSLDVYGYWLMATLTHGGDTCWLFLKVYFQCLLGLVADKYLSPNR